MPLVRVSVGWLPDGVCAHPKGENSPGRTYKVARLRAEQDGGTPICYPTASSGACDSMPTVFISHAQNDTDFADTVATKLTEAGHKVWLDDSHIGAGQDWRAEIDRGIEDSDALIVVMSPEANISQYVTYEWAFALGQRRVVIPLLLRPSDLHPRLAGLHHLDFTRPRTRPWKDLLKRVNEAGGLSEEVAARSIDFDLPKALRVGVLHFPPLAEYKVDGDTIRAWGLCTYLIEAVAAAHDVALTFQPVRMEDAEEAFGSKRLDCIAGALHSHRRARVFDFAGLLHSVRLVGVKKEDEERVSEPADLEQNGIRVVVPTGGVASEVARDVMNLPNDAERLTEVTTRGIAEVLAQVETRQADVALIDGVSYRAYSIQRQGLAGLRLAFPDRPLWHSPAGFMLSKHNRLGPWLNRELRKARTSAEFLRRERDVLVDFGDMLERLA